MSERNAVYVGSFDPIHLGHLWVISEGAKLFDKLYITIGNNTTKSHLFTKDERIDIASMAVDDLPFSNVFVSSLKKDELTADYAKNRDCSYLLRGLRGSQDLIYESSVQYVNAQLHPTIQTIFLNTPLEFQYISSSIIRELLKLKKYDLLKEKYISASIYDFLIKAWEKKNGNH